MKINFTQTIDDLDGKPIVDKDGEVTLRKLAVDALLMTLLVNGQAEVLDGSAKARNAQLAQVVYSCDDVDLKVEDVALIKDRIGRAFAPLAVMRAWELLDQ